MPRVDVDAVLRAKAPGLASWLRAPLVRWLRRTVHEREINHILDSFSHQPPREFIQSCFRTWGVTYSIEGLEALDPAGGTCSPPTIRSAGWTA